MTKIGSDPNQPYPTANQRRVCYIKNLIKLSSIIVGDYSYYDDPIDPEKIEKNILYHYGSEKLIIGKFCAIATNVKFIMNSANHKLDGISTYPFPILGNGWETAMNLLMKLLSKGDTVICNDVLIGYQSVIMPGVKIGNGAIIVAKSVLVKNIPVYAVVGGNPAGLIKQRFNDAEVAQLLAIRWWDWEIDKI